MAIKQQITDAISQQPTDKSKLQLSWKNEERSLGAFSLVNEASGKSMSGTFIPMRDGVVAWVDEHNYSAKYARRKLRNEFAKRGIDQRVSFVAWSWEDAEEFIEEVTEVRTKQFIGQLDEGDKKVLEQGDTWYSSDFDTIENCNGSTLSFSYRARFLREEDVACETGEVHTYTRFLILERLS